MADPEKPAALALLTSSIGRKMVMSLTGLLLLGFLVAHVAGNMTLFVDGATFDAYTAKLKSYGPLLYVAEVGLIVLFVAHMATAVRLSLGNREARKTRYVVRNDRGQSTVASRSMILSGLVVAVFLVVHLIDFRFDDAFNEAPAGLVQEKLSSPGKGAFYIVCMVVLGLHLSHGIRSSVQSLGISHPRLEAPVRFLGIGLAFLLAVLFAAIPAFLILSA
jgi:succinate dehydrogenase / fumarate reductase cytochrome b subunit